MQNDATVSTIEIHSNETLSKDEPDGTEPQLPNDWGEWQWQIRNSIRTIEQLRQSIESVRKSVIFSDKTYEASQTFPLAITPYYFSLIKTFDYTDPVFSMAVPNEKELNNPSYLSNDPLAEEHDTVIDNLVHRYEDRALLLATSQCAMFCRHCTRKRVAGTKDFTLSETQLNNIITYLQDHPQIKDIIISGGDPLTMATDKLERILKKLRTVSTIEIIRIGTRTPVTLPMRITDELVQMISKYHPVWINTHFNHPNEITPESTKACEKLVNSGIPVNNQCVLLKGINDNVKIMAELFTGLLKMRVRPYYMFQCDLVNGVEHFRTPISKGLEIVQNLRGRISGLGIPAFIVDSPEGKGKIPLLPNAIIETTETQTILKNYQNEQVCYPEPVG
jgi:lysine 2,3-aminomutase